MCRMKKNTLLIVIDSLEKGGAEVLLIGMLPELNKIFSITLVTLSEKNDFKNEEIICDKRYILGFSSKLSVFGCILKLKKIINLNQPSIIHAHLFYSSLIARIACPSSIPLIYSLHNEMSKSVFNNSRVLTFIEKNTIRPNHTLIAVSKGVLIDYENTIRKKITSFVLRNYVSDIYFKKKISEKNFNYSQQVKLVAIGNIKDQKNYIYLLKAFGQLTKYNISLDIYGNGTVRDLKTFRDKVTHEGLPIFFKGRVENPSEILPHYDLYVSCSKHEGFGIAPVEAMVLGLPLLLSDLSVFREITLNNALFFDVNNPLSFVNLIKEIFERKYNLEKLSRDGIEASKQYTKESYLKKLFNIYNNVLWGIKQEIEFSTKNTINS